MGSLSLLQGIFPTQGSNQNLPHCRQILYQLSHKGSPRILEWVAYPLTSGSSRPPRNRTRVSCISGGFFTNSAIRGALFLYLDKVKTIFQYATGDQWRNNSRKNEGMEPKQKQLPAVDVTGDRSKVRCCKEQYCIGTWNVRSMNQGKLEVAKQEMARVNIDILGISKLRWTGIGECNSDDHYIFYCGQESLRRNGVAIIVNKSPKCSTWMQSQK